MKESVYQRLATEISLDNINIILTEVKERLNNGTTALKLLVHANKLVYTAVTQKTDCKSSVNDIVQLCDICCSTIVSKWTPSIEKSRVYGSLYQIINYLTVKDSTEHINNLCSYIFSIHEQSKEAENEEEKKILQNFIVRLVVYIGGSFEKHCQCLVSKSEQSLLTLCELILKLDSLCNYANNSTYLTFLHCICHFCQSKGDNNFSKSFLQFQIECLKSLTPNIVSDFDKLIRILFSTMSEIVKLKNECSFLLEYAKMFENSVDDKNKKIFSLFYNIIIFLTSKSEETFLLAVNECNLILKSSSNENISAITVSCKCVIVLIFYMRSDWLMRVSNFKLNARDLEQTLEFFSNLYDILKEQQNDACILPSGEKCLLKVDTNQLINCQYLILDIISTCGKNLNDKECCVKALTAQNECLCLLKQMIQLKCPKLQTSCNYIYVGFVKVSRFLEANCENELEFITTAYKFIFTLPVETVRNPEFTCKVLALAACLGNTFQKNGQLDKALTVLTAFASLCTGSGEQLFNLWADFKHNQIVLYGDSYVELTVYDIFKKKKEELETNWNVCSVSNNQIISFLMWEIQVYYKNSLLRGKPLLAAFSNLRKLTGDTILNGKALVMAMEVSTSSDKYSSELEKHVEISNKILPMLIKQVSKKKDCKDGELEFLIGDILFQQFRSDVRTARNKSSGEILFSSKLSEKAIKRTHLEDLDPNDTCRVNPVYSSLSIKVQVNLLKKIDEAVKQWEMVCAKVTEKPEMIAITLENICNAALLYKLYCLENKEKATWHLMYILAKRFNEVKMKIVAITGLLDYNDDLPADWIEECLADIDKENINSTIKYSFQINWFKRVMQRKEEVGLPVYNKFNIEWKNHKITQIMSLLKLYNLQSISSGYNLEGSVPAELQVALSMCLGCALISNEPYNFSHISRIHDFGLQASYDLGVIYWNMKLPRHARCYLKSHINVAQKLALPLRTAQLLCILTWLDVDCGNTTDAYEKLQGLEAILDIEHSEGTGVQTYSTSSPNFKKSCIKLPEFLNHKNGCKCFPCDSIEYQRLVLEAVTLRAEYSVLMKDKTNSLNFFKVGFEIIDVFEQRKVTSEALKILQVRLWLRYAALQAFLKNYAEAIKANRKAEQLVDVNNLLTTFEVAAQLCYLELAQCKVSAKFPVSVTNKSTIIKNNRTPRKLEMKDFKTPHLLPKADISGKSPLSVNNKFITPVQPMRPLILDSSDDEDDEKHKENVPVSQRKIKKKHSTPPNIVLHSPMALSSRKKEKKIFNIFSDESENSSLKIKKTYGSNCTKKKTEQNKKALPSNDVSYVTESKKRLFCNVSGKAVSKLRVAKNGCETTVKCNKSTRTLTHTQTSTSTTVSNQVSLSTKKYTRSTRNDSSQDTFNFDEIKSALNDSTCSSVGSVVEGTPPKPAKRTLRLKTQNKTQN